MAQSFGNITNTGGAKIISGFGKRGAGYHYGIDLGYPSGTPITAPLDGVIIAAEDISETDGCGGMIQIDHGDVNGAKLVTLFCHVKEFKKSKGDKVSTGDIVGLSGGGVGDPMSGRTTGAHIHFAVKENGKFVDPAPYVNKSVSVTKQDLPNVSDIDFSDVDFTDVATSLVVGDPNKSGSSDAFIDSLAQQAADLIGKPILKGISKVFNEDEKLQEEIKRIKQLLK